jgi:hypothetical protein
MKEQSVGFRKEYSICSVGNKALRRLSDRRVSFVQAKDKLKTSVQTQQAGRDADRLLMSLFLTACPNIRSSA